MCKQLRPEPFDNGYEAFAKALGECPYPFGSEDYAAWWKGWQLSAEDYLLTEFQKADEK